MTSARTFEAIADALAGVIGARPDTRSATPVHGGCINESYRWESRNGSLFLKVAPGSKVAMLEAEAAGLEELARAHAVRVPKVLAVGTADDCTYLALEWIDLTSTSVTSQSRLGELLAQQHRFKAPTFGWHRDNTIGSTPQVNTQSTDWGQFFRERRLRYQLELAAHNGFRGDLQEQGAQLLERTNAFFETYRPNPSLLHGDLWGGNWGADRDGSPVIFDPAVYYGDREADIAMTRLFGGFAPAFYHAYENAWPVDSGARARSDLYNLYHVLNHLNLFGRGYLTQAQSMIDRLLAGLRG